MSFGPRTDYAVDVDPVGIAAADLTGSGSPDLVIAASTAPAAIGADSSPSYRIDVLLNNGAGSGTFAASAPFVRACL